MKKVFRILPVLAALSSTPLFSMLNSCAPVCNKCYREVDFSIDKINNLNDTKQASTNLEKIISGDKSYHNGNYILIFGSECSSESNKLFGQHGDQYEDYVNSNCIGNSKFAEAFETIKKQYYNNLDFGIQLYIDLETQQEAKNDQKEWYDGAVSFDQKWEGRHVTDAEKIYDSRKSDSKYDSNRKFYDRVRNKDYIRTDDSAIKMRSLVSYMQTLFTSEVIPMAGSTNLPYAMVWLKGVPQIKQFKQLNGTTCYDDLVNMVKYLEKGKEEEKTSFDFNKMWNY